MSASAASVRPHAVLRIPRLTGAGPGAAAYLRPPALQELRRAVIAARDEGRITGAAAARELAELRKAMEVASVHGRAVVAYHPREVVELRSREDDARRTRRKAARRARRINRRPKRRKRKG